MHYDSYKQRWFIRWLLLSVLALLLAACSTSSVPDIQTPSSDYAYVGGVSFDTEMTQAEIEAIYGGSAIVFKPEAGFAVLGFSEDQAAMTTLATTANVGTFKSPEVRASGFDAWAGGFDAWAGGFDAWAGGWDAWAGGFDAWAGGWDAWAGGFDAWAGGFDAWAGGASGVVAGGLGNNETAFDRIKLDEAHALSRTFGQGVKVAVIDTGIDFGHPMFEGRLAPSWQWKDYIDNDSYPQEVSGGNGYGHGTAAAGIILQIAPKATILPIRVLDANGRGDTDDVILAAEHAINMGADIISLSVGSDYPVPSLDLMIDYLNTLNVYVVASAGNNGPLGNLTYPARSATEGDYKKLISVSSVNTADVPSGFASHSADLQYFAPGEQIASAYPGGGSARVSGTSFATPMVAGTLALGLSEVSSSYHNRLNGYLMQSMDAIGFGDGRLNIEAFIRNLPGWSEPEYEIVAAHSGKCVEVPGADTRKGVDLEQDSCNGGAAQRWTVELVGEYVKLTNVNSNKVIDVEGVSAVDGAIVHQWSYGGGDNQLWSLKAAANGYQLVSKHSGKCVDISNGSSSNGAALIQWTCHDDANQQFKFRRLN